MDILESKSNFSRSERTGRTLRASMRYSVGRVPSTFLHLSATGAMISDRFPLRPLDPSRLAL
jgi:hypothetical protein